MSSPTDPEDRAADEGTDVIVYELDEFTADERGALDQRLVAAGIEHQWETADGLELDESYEMAGPWEIGTDLVVGERDEEAVDALLDEVDSPDALAAVDDDDAIDDEANYAIMSHLYVAADRLKDDPSDLALAGEFFDAADAAGAIPAPFGIDGEIWRRVQELGAEVTRSLEAEADDAVVAGHAQRLRDVLFSYV